LQFNPWLDGIEHSIEIFRATVMTNNLLGTLVGTLTGARTSG